MLTYKVITNKVFKLEVKVLDANENIIPIKQINDFQLPFLFTFPLIFIPKKTFQTLYVVTVSNSVYLGGPKIEH